MPQAADGRGVGETGLVQVNEDVDDEVVVGPSLHQARDGVGLHVRHLLAGIT